MYRTLNEVLAHFFVGPVRFQGQLMLWVQLDHYLRVTFELLVRSPQI